MSPAGTLLTILFMGTFVSAQDSSPKTIQGWHYYERGEYEQARKKFKEALRKNGGEAEAMTGLGWCSLKMGKLEEAEKQFRKVLEKDPASTSALQGLTTVTQQRWATLTLANSLTNQGYFDQAILLYDQILRKKDRNFPGKEIWRARLGKAWCLYWQGEHSEAEDHFEMVLREREAEPTALQGLGYSLYQRKKYEAAREPLEQALKIYPQWFGVIDNLGWCELKTDNLRKAIAYFKEAIKLSPTTADAHAGAAWARQKGGRTEQAISHFIDAIALDPRYVETDEFRKLLSRERDYRELMLPLGEAYLAQGEYRTAISRLRRAIRVEDTLRVRANLGYAQLQLKKYEEVVSTLESISSTAPEKESIAWKNGTSTLGWAHYHKGNHQKASQIFRRIGAMAEIGWCLVRQGKLGEAERIFKTVLEGTPGNELATSGLTRIQEARRSSLDLGWQEFHAAQFDKALASFQKALSENLPTRNVWEANLGLGWCHIKKEDYEKAEKALRDARYEALNATLPSSARATVRIAIGWTRFGQGNFQSAIDAFENARETFPDSIDVYRGLGWSHFRMDQKENALHAFQQGLKISPRDPSCSEGIALLQPDTMGK